MKMLTRLPRFALLIILLRLLQSCSAQKEGVYNNELQQLKNSSLGRLAADVEEFNTYKNRPLPDGPFNATNNKEFLLENVPLFSCSDSSITKVYNYRWWMISKHLKQYHDTEDGKDYWVVTEFFGVMPWATLSGAITCPAGHQFYDVRWLRDNKFLKSYADYLMKGSASRLQQRENDNFLTYLSRPESHHFSSWMVNGIEAYLKVHPDKEWMHGLLPAMEQHQQVWDSLFRVKNAGAKTNGMYKILDLYDGMEFSLSAVLGLIESDGAYNLYTKDTWKNYYLGWETTGNADASLQAKQYPKAFRKGYPDFYLVRPSVNSYAYGNLQSLANMYELNGNSSKSGYYTIRAEAVRQKALDVLWDKETRFFNSYSAGDNEFGIRDYEAHVRESVGYTPWYFGLIPPDDYATYSNSWDMFSSREGFYNTKGMTTAEQQHPYYNEQAYAWNGRGWPFENSVVYKGYANYLRDYKKAATEPEKQLLHDYIKKLAEMHGKKELNIGEWYIPSSGEAFGGVQDYFHSTFPDIIIEDLLGFKAMHQNRFSIQPLLPKNKWDYFYLGNLLYHSHEIDIIWKKDWDAGKPGNQSALCVWIDGKLTVTGENLDTKLVVEL